MKHDTDFSSGQTHDARADRFIAVLQLLKPLSIHCTVNTAIAFLTVATRPGVTVGDVQRILGLQPTSTSRALSLLYRQARGIPGLDLVTSIGSDDDLRVKHLFLTPKGSALWARITKHL